MNPVAAEFPCAPQKSPRNRAPNYREPQQLGVRAHGLNLPMAGLGPESDSGIHRTVFFCCRHDTEASKFKPYVIPGPSNVFALIVPDMGTYSARRLVISPPPVIVGLLPTIFRIASLLDAQGGAVSAVPPQKKSAQIGHRITENREQFGVRAAWAGNPPMAGLGPESGQRYSPDGFLLL